MNHCWTGRKEWIEETYGHDSQEYSDFFFYEENATCMLEGGHCGPHLWTPDKSISVAVALQPREGGE